MKFLVVFLMVLTRTNLFTHGFSYLDYFYGKSDPLDNFSTSAPSSLMPENVTVSVVNDDEEFVEISDTIFNDIANMRDMRALEQILGIQEKMRNAAPTLSTEEESLLRSKSTDLYLKNPEQAHCEPELQTVDLGLRSTNAITYYPTCIRVMQCGGCCQGSDIMSCQPTASEKAVVKVLKLVPQTAGNEVSGRLTRNRQRRRRNSVRVRYNAVNVTVELHTECRCMCKVRESDCDLTVHDYYENSCSCICKNGDEEYKCRQKRSHVWDKSTCKCLCRKKIDCSSGNTFDHNTCECIPEPISVSWDDLYLRRSQPSSRDINRRKPVEVPIDTI